MTSIRRHESFDKINSSVSKLTSRIERRRNSRIDKWPAQSHVIALLVLTCSDHITRSSLESFLSTSYASSGGLVDQMPPLFSALKQNGERLSHLAREGMADTVNLESKTRPVQVYSIRIVEFDPPFFTLDVRCGSGFYIRSLIRDIGEHFGCGAVMIDLMRTSQNGFDINDQRVISMEHVAERIQRQLIEDGAKPTKNKKTKSKKSPLPTTESFEQSTDPSTAASSSSSSSPAPSARVDSLSISIPSSSLFSTADYHHLACTRENILQVLAIPLSQRQQLAESSPSIGDEKNQLEIEDSSSSR